MALAHIKDNKNFWTVVLNGKPHQFDSTHPEYTSLVECVKVGDQDEFLRLFETGTVIENWSEGNFEFRDGFLFFDGEQIASQPTERIIELIKQGWDYRPMLRYLENLYSNVSKRAVQESYSWCMHKGLPITDDGYLVGYKGVVTYNGEEKTDKLGRQLKSGDLVDKYTQTFRNNVGDINHMPRRQVCDDHTKGCDSGLHVGTYEYASDWISGMTGAVVLVKFHPGDIVSVPSDCEFQKMRVSQYEVIAIASERLEEAVYSSESEEDEDEDEDEDMDWEAYDDDYGYDDDDDDDDDDE
jgi:hypothetical protein